MPCFPVIADEIAEVEAKLGIALPSAWKTNLLDPRIRRVMMDKKIGLLRPTDTMKQFAALTRKLRASQPKFPAHGVLMFCGHRHGRDYMLDFGFASFWLPDKKLPNQLGDATYNWDLVRQRQTRETSTTLDWIDSALRYVDESLLKELGLARPAALPPSTSFKTRDCDAELMNRLSMRDAKALAMLASVGGQWLPCTQLSVTGSYLTPTDLGQIPSASYPAIKIEPGTFDVQVRLSPSSLGAWPVVGGVRILRRGIVTTRHKVFELDVDLAAIAVFDRQSFLKQVPYYDRDYFCEEFVDALERPCVAQVGRSAEVLIMPSGNGDGTYPVFELRAKGQTIGMEIVFIAD